MGGWFQTSLGGGGTPDLRCPLGRGERAESQAPLGDAGTQIPREGGATGIWVSDPSGLGGGPETSDACGRYAGPQTLRGRGEPSLRPRWGDLGPQIPRGHAGPQILWEAGEPGFRPRGGLWGPRVPDPLWGEGSLVSPLYGDPAHRPNERMWDPDRRSRLGMYPKPLTTKAG